METNNRIKLWDTAHSAVLKMGDGNPGAITAMMHMIEDKNKKIDPYNIFGGFGSILLLDTFEIYGTDIYVLYNDICGGNVTAVFTLLRACQMGLLDRNILKDACGRQDRSGKDLIDIPAVYKRLKEELPNFDLDENFVA